MLGENIVLGRNAMYTVYQQTLCTHKIRNNVSIFKYNFLTARDHRILIIDFHIHVFHNLLIKLPRDDRKFDKDH